METIANPLALAIAGSAIQQLDQDLNPELRVRTAA
jgi:hypothetical protein